ncbi:hypothetical protein GINT2_000083 [Glugoides intestinalis]
MGITGLLPLIHKAFVKAHISRYSNTRIGIDGHSWIHRAIPSIATEIYYNKPTKRHLDLLISKIKSLTDYNITPIFVLDGDFLECKKKTNEERKQLKEKYKLEVEICIKRNNIERAKELMKRCVGVTPEILYSVLKTLQASNIEFIISPYEADAQLCFLQKIGYIDYILTEDSDLIVYGATKILYKFDGTYVSEYDSSRLVTCRDKFFHDNILDICILSGCDYLDSIKGVGLITAHEKLKELGTLESFVTHMASRKKTIPNDYFELFWKAKATFLHHIVYNPYTSKRQFLSEPTTMHSFLGTLEDIQMKIMNRSVSRHFKPVTLKKSVSENSEECSCSEELSFVIDSNLKLPYFHE